MVAISTKKKPKLEYVALNIPDGTFTEDDFFEFCQLNDGLKIERLSTGEIVIMSLTGGNTGIRNTELTTEFGIWNRQKKQGRVFDSSTGFRLPNGAVYSPDVSWIPLKKWEKLAATQKEKFVPLCPDFICELASSKRQVNELKEKMEEFMENGCRLGWLIDPYNKVTYVYLPDKPTDEVSFSKNLTGKGVLKGLRIKMENLMEV